MFAPPRGFIQPRPGGLTFPLSRGRLFATAARMTALRGRAIYFLSNANVDIWRAWEVSKRGAMTCASENENFGGERNVKVFPLARESKPGKGLRLPTCFAAIGCENSVKLPLSTL